MMLVIATVAAPLDRTQLGEFLLPVAQDMRLYATQLAHFTDREVALGRNGRKTFPAIAGCCHAGMPRPPP